MTWRRRRSFRLRQPAQKNYYQNISNGVALNVASTNLDLVNASGTPNGVDQIDYPSTVAMVYLDVTLVYETAPALLPENVIILWKNPGNNMGSPTPAQLLALGNWQGVSEVIQAWQGIPGTYNPDNNSMRIRGWIRIPRRHRIYNENDRLRLSFGSNNASTVSICTLGVYKWRA